MISLSLANTPNCYFNFQAYVHTIGLEQAVLREGISKIERALDYKVYLLNKVSVYEVNPSSGKISFKEQAAYDIDDNAIYLNKGFWCRVTVIHELLHAISFFIRPRYVNLGLKIKPLIEAFTEFLTGYVLWKYKDKWPCYYYWVLRKYEICGVLRTYEDGIRAIATLCRLISIHDIIELYMWNPSHNFYTIYNKFIKRHKIASFIKKVT